MILLLTKILSVSLYLILSCLEIGELRNLMLLEGESIEGVGDAKFFDDLFIDKRKVLKFDIFSQLSEKRADIRTHSKGYY